MPDLPASGGLHVHPGYRVFDTNDGLLEQVTGLVLRRPAAQRGPTGEGAAATLLDLPEAVGARLSGIRHAIAVVPHESLEGVTLPDEVEADEAASVGSRVSVRRRCVGEPRRRAPGGAPGAERFAGFLPRRDIELTDRADGKPLQRVALPSGRMLEKLDLSLADDTRTRSRF